MKNRPLQYFYLCSLLLPQLHHKLNYGVTLSLIYIHLTAHFPPASLPLTDLVMAGDDVPSVFLRPLGLPVSARGRGEGSATKLTPACMSEADTFLQSWNVWQCSNKYAYVVMELSWWRRRRREGRERGGRGGGGSRLQLCRM